MPKNLNKIILNIEPLSRRLSFTEMNVYDLLMKNGIKIRALCGGEGTCGQCKIIIKKGVNYLNEPTKKEHDLLDAKKLNDGWRLSCQTQLNQEHIASLIEQKPPQIKIFIPSETLVGNFSILTSGTNDKLTLKPVVKAMPLKISKPSLSHPVADYERILNALSEKNTQININKLKIAYEALKNLAERLRQNDHHITLIMWDQKKIIDCIPGDHNKTDIAVYGVAFDIGTTTIVGYLLNLLNGKIYAVDSTLNPQTAYGEDVVTRIKYTKKNEDGLTKLHSELIESLNKIIENVCTEAGINHNHIYEVTVVGNSVMHHLFLNLTPLYVGLSPYIPTIQKALDMKPQKVNLAISPMGNVHILPVIAGFVGADTIGVILSSRIYEAEELTLAIDIGTNGELVIGNKDFLIAGSCAAGSALEGAHIKAGMRAAGGAIDSISIDHDTLEVNFTTIKEEKPIGICGSGLVDAITEMLKAKILTRSGNFNKDIMETHPEMFDLKHKKNSAFILVGHDRTAHGEDIILTQDDIRQIQMAKGAFYSGTRIMMAYIHENFDSNAEIQQVYLAGAFGNYIDKKNAKFIGMIPDIADEKVFQIGNAAGIGAQHALVNEEMREKAETISNQVEYIEIAVSKKFQMEYAKAMYFPHFDLDLFPSLTAYKTIPKR